MTVVLVPWLVATLACNLSAGSLQREPTLTPRPPALIASATTPAQAVETAPTGRVYYVAANEPGASDSNNGLYPAYQSGQDGPWLSVQHAAKTMGPGDTTFVRAGTYFESDIAFVHSGTPDAPITLGGYASEQVILDGSQARHESSGIQITEGQGHYVIEGFAIRNMPRSGIATDGDTSEPYRDITIRDCVLYDNGLSGIRLAAVDGFLIENVEAHDNAYYGLDIIGSDDGRLPAANGAVSGSSFHHHTGREGHGLAINQGHDITVSDSLAYHNTIHGFDVSDMPKGGLLSYNVTFTRNSSYDNGVAGFSVNSDSHHVVYLRNVAWRNGADWAGHGAASGFLCYEGCWHVEWYNNVSAENTDAGFWIEDPPGGYGTPGDYLLVFKNNISYNNDSENLWAPALVVEGESLWQVIATHNDWHVPPGQSVAVYNQGTQYTPDEINGGLFQTGNLSVNPQFVDPAQPDFRLRPGSPCIDAGVDVGLLYLGPAPDIGALEFER